MEDDIIFTYEIIALDITLPEIVPSLAIARRFSPFLRCREIANHCLEPDIDAFFVIAGQRHRYTPLYIARDSAVPEPLRQIAKREI